MTVNYKGCPFCELTLTSSDILFENDRSISIKDKYPVVNNHTLIITKRHIPSFFDLTEFEKNQCMLMLDRIKIYLLQDESYYWI